jgi:hypothetical protein
MSADSVLYLDVFSVTSMQCFPINIGFKIDIGSIVIFADILKSTLHTHNSAHVNFSGTKYPMISYAT